MSSQIQPTTATGRAMIVNENIDMLTSAELAMPAISRLELVPTSVMLPARVVAWAIGSRTCRAGIALVCCSSLTAGISMATIGVVLMRADATPTGTIRRRSVWDAVVTVDSNRHVTRETTPV